MKRILIIALILGTTLQAVQINPPGSAAATGAKTATDSNWQNWAFAGTMILTAAAGVFAASVASGTTAQGH